MSSYRHPVVAVSHGPGPLWLLSRGVQGMDKKSEAAKNVRSIFKRIYPNADSPLPKRIVFVSAHWESATSGTFEISKSSAPQMIYDYGGMDREAYEIVYGAKGDPEFAKRVSSLLGKAQIKNKLVERGYDHGVFVPMFLMRPSADIPIVSVSINDGLDAKAHLELGRALAPLRDEDTLIICSGQLTHNMRWIGQPTYPVSDWALEFQDWIDSVMSLSPLSFAERSCQLETWLEVAPSVHLAHPSPDHFTPFVVAAGAGMSEAQPAADKLFGGWGSGHLSFASYAWGITK